MTNDNGGADPQGKAKKRKRALSPHYKANNEGGFGNPPVSGQFKGEPGPGRPKGSTSFDGTMKKMIRGSVPLKNGGSVPYYEALASSAREASLKKTPSSTEFGFKLIREFSGEGEESKPKKLDLSALNDVEMKLALFIFARAEGKNTDRYAEEMRGHYVIDWGADGELIVRYTPLPSDEEESTTWDDDA